LTTTLVTGGLVVTAAGRAHADVLCEDGLIVALGRDLGAGADLVVDARERYVIPGGVDPHVHLEMPFGGTVTCDDFTSGTIAAAYGGTTSVLDFCIQEHGQSFPDALAAWHAKVERGAPVADVGCHMAVTDLDDPARVAELAEMPAAGVTSLKIFMAYKGAIMVDDAVLLQTLRVGAASGSLVMVHAENGDAIDLLIREALAAGHTEPVWHGRTRPPITEAEATSRAIDLATLAGARLFVVHVSCRESLAPIARARAAGLPVSAETCVQYLLLDESILDAPGFEGAKAVFTPPPRAAENQEHLWQALETGILELVSTDHCAFRIADQKTLGRDDFSKIPNGGPGIEHRLELLHEFGVRAGRLSLERWVELCCSVPAQRFGMGGRKGTIAVGADADLVVWDPARTRTIAAATHHSAVDYSLYEGVEVRGGAEAVLLRGAPVILGGELVAEPARGRFLHRDRV
jgi:dihydropyrimidinase